ncbi:MAG: hypothetical protein QXE16_03760 [Candidatus Bathyarchaeia archaeon]
MAVAVTIRASKIFDGKTNFTKFFGYAAFFRFCSIRFNEKIYKAYGFITEQIVNMPKISLTFFKMTCQTLIQTSLGGTYISIKTLTEVDLADGTNFYKNITIYAD